MQRSGYGSRVIPWETLGRAHAPGGGELILQRRGTEVAIRLDGYVLMSNRAHDSEEALASLTCPLVAPLGTPRVLIGGLGLGYTLRAALDRLPQRAQVVVAELVPAVVEWNRGPLAEIAGRPLEDPRVRVEADDVGAVIARAADGAPFDALLLDVDNGPAAFTRPANASLYDRRGLGIMHAALRAGGVMGMWSAVEDRAFANRLRAAGFAVETPRVAARGRTGTKHTVFLARRRERGSA